MKKVIYLFILGIGFTGCSIESLDSAEDMLTLDAKAKQQAEQNGKFVVPELICAGEPAEFYFEAPVNTNLQVQQLNNGEWVQVYQISKSTSNPQIFELTFAAAGDYQLRYKIGSGGFTEIKVTVQNCGCEESFSYTDNGDGTYAFTYIPEEDMEAAELVFTFAQGLAVSGLADWDKAGVTMQKVMDLKACTTYSWTVELDADCKGRGQQTANLWTDFKVNDESKKGELANIVKACN